MKTFLLTGVLFLFLSININAQSTPQVLDSSIRINRIMTVKNGVIRVALDPVSQHIFYVQTGGNIYEVIQPDTGVAYDSLIFTTANHTVEYVQNFAFFDSTLYVSGNNHSDSALTAGIIARGKLQPDGSRLWDTLMITQYYQTADYFDHLFSGLALSPAGDSIYICSGARGDHGEVQTRYGIYPGLRNVPLTTNIYALPTNDSTVITLLNDSAALAASGYVYCRGVRNHFDMAFDSNGNFFGVENSGDRDHNEEMNWLRRDHHYGFPWKMGDTDNPQQFVPFDPATDKLINHFSRSWRLGFFSNDPAFPQAPPGVTFDEPIQNYGPDCDKYRDTSGAVLDASDSSVSMGTFTAHRSPLGLVFDNAHMMSSTYNGDGFMLSWTQGYDSCGCSTPPDTSIGPFVDPSEDLVHLDLSFDSLAGNFRLNATRIISDFEHPVDADINGNKIYVIENGYGGTSGLFVVTMPLPCDPLIDVNIPELCDPDSNIVSIPSFGTLPNDYYWYNSSGTLIRSDTGFIQADTVFSLPIDNYYVVINDSAGCGIDTLTFIIPDTVRITIDSVRHTTCVVCIDGIIDFSVTGGSPPYLYTSTVGTIINDSLINIPAGPVEICVSDANGCISCISDTILQDPTGIVSNYRESDFVLYPNPATKSATLKINGGGKVSVKLLDMNGRELKILMNEIIRQDAHEMILDLSGIAKGTYTLEILNNERRVYKKLILAD